MSQHIFGLIIGNSLTHEPRASLYASQCSSLITIMSRSQVIYSPHRSLDTPFCDMKTSCQKFKIFEVIRR